MIEYNFNEKKHDKQNTKRVITNEKLYNKTLILACFFGMFGIHRIINDRKKSGFILLTFTVISLFLTIIKETYPDHLIMIFSVLSVGTIGVIVVALIAFFSYLGLWFVSIWAFIDIIMIFNGKFTIGVGNLELRSGKRFLKLWSNIVAMISIIIAIFITSVVQTTIPNYIIEVSSQRNYYNMYNSDQNTLFNCINNMGFYVPKSDNAFLEEIDSYFDANGYNLSISENEVLARKDISINEEEFYIDLMFMRSQGGQLFYVCNMAIRNNENTIYISNNMDNKVSIVYDDLVRGEFDIQTNTISLYTEECIKDCEGLTCHGDECDEYIQKKDYEIEIDEYEIMDFIYILIDTYKEELESLQSL